MVKTLPSNPGGAGSIPGQGAEIPHTSGQKTKTKQKQYCNKFNKDFKNGPYQKKKNSKKKNTSYQFGLPLFGFFWLAYLCNAGL